MLELARAVIEVTGSKSKLQFEPLPQDDPRRRCPDISKARRVLKWEPRVDLKTGLANTAAFYRRTQFGDER
jgi:UDP-glucuronate decarboxylase